MQARGNKLNVKNIIPIILFAKEEIGIGIITMSLLVKVKI